MSKPLRVLHVTGAYLPSTAYGGPIESTHQLLRAVRATGLEVEVLTTDADGRQRLASGTRELDGIRVHYHQTVPLNRHGIAPGLFAAAAVMAGRFDLIHCHGTALLSTTVGLWAGLLHGRPLVLTPRGSLMTWARSKKALRKRAYRLLDAVPLRRTALHATSDAEAQQARDAGFGDVFVVPNAVELADYAKPAGGDLRTELGLPGSARLVAWMGRFDPVKNVAVLLEATRDIPVEVLLAGDAHGEYADSLRRAAVASRAGGVHFLGHVSGERKVRLLQQADVYAHPSFMESYGMSIAEALAAGCPVVASTGTPWAELDQAGAGRWVAPTAEAFRRAISELLAAAAPQVNASARTLAAKHGWEGRARQLVLEYERIIGRESRALTR